MIWCAMIMSRYFPTRHALRLDEEGRNEAAPSNSPSKACHFWAALTHSSPPQAQLIEKSVKGEGGDQGFLPTVGKTSNFLWLGETNNRDHLELNWTQLNCGNPNYSPNINFYVNFRANSCKTSTFFYLWVTNNLDHLELNSTAGIQITVQTIIFTYILKPIYVKPPLFLPLINQQSWPSRTQLWESKLQSGHQF